MKEVMCASCSPLATDVILDWESGAAARHEHLGIPLEKLFAARDLVRGAMGGLWFEDQERRHERVGIKGEHPLYRQLTSPNDLALVQVAELAHYLLALQQDPGLPGLITDLRAGKFWQRSTNWRWRTGGSYHESARAHTVDIGMVKRRTP